MLRDPDIYQRVDRLERAVDSLLQMVLVLAALVAISFGLWASGK